MDRLGNNRARTAIDRLQVKRAGTVSIAGPDRLGRNDIRIMSFDHGYDPHMQRVGHSLTETFDAAPEAVAVGRSRVADFAEAAGADRTQVESIRLAVSEAITNAVLHAYRGSPGPISLHASVADGELWVFVTDEGVGLDAAAEQPGLGLGLGLISRLSDEFTILPRSSGGTELRIRFDLVPAGHRTPAPRNRRDRARTRGLGLAGPSDLTASVAA